MNVAYLIGSLVGAVGVLDGIWMIAYARPLLHIPRWNPPKTLAAQRWTGMAETLGGAGIAAGFGVLAAYGPVPAGLYIVGAGVVGQLVCYVGAWLVDYRAGRPVSN
jgi:hypothetical protein